MASNIKIIVIFTMLMSISISQHVIAAEIEDVNFDDIYEVEGIQLKIQGTGLFMYLAVVKVYVGALYLEESASVENVLSDIPKRLEVEYFQALRGKDFGVTTNKMIAKNTDFQTLQNIKPQIDYHNGLYEDVEPGDRYSLTYVPGKGTTLALNGKVKGTIEGADFASALFSMWLGKFPMNKPFKKQLLGLQ